MITFTVHGIPQPAGSKKGFYNKRAGRVIITDDAKKSRPWKAQVADAAAHAINGAALLDGPLELVVRFYVPRPKGHYGTGRNAGAVRSSAPAYPAVKPDVTKLLRAVEDACNGVIWRDDAQVVIQKAFKEYGEPARCVIGVAPIQQTIDQEVAA